MLWESSSDNKDDPNERGWGSNNPNPLNPPVTPVLVPSQSGQRTVQQAVPVIVPDVEELKEQFQQQQNMLTQLKETIKENESQLSSKEKKVEAYANKLSQIRARSKNNDPRSNISQKTTPTISKSLTKRSSKENLAKESENSIINMESKEKLSPKGKIGELKKRLQESKIKFEERTGKEVSETKKIESIVENLRMQLEERDVTIHELQKIVEQPANVKSDTSIRKSKGKLDGRPISTKSTQTMRHQPNEESIEIIALQNRIRELEANILDLEESLKEKESVIEARTQAVTLLSQDLSIKGKNTLECLEETRQEMRSMQSNFIVIENQLKKELVEKDDELTSTEEKLKKLESINAELNMKNAQLEETVKKLERDMESGKSLGDSMVQVQSDDKLAELTNKINSLHKELDDSNKTMIRMKLENKNKIKSLNKTIEKLKETSDDKAEILRLQTIVEEFEVMRESFQNKIAELEEEKVTEKKLKDTINELEAQIRQQSVEIENHLQTISNLEAEKHELLQSSQDQNILIENLYAKIQNHESECAANAEKVKEVEERLEAAKSEHAKEIESIESYYNLKMAGGDRKEFEEYRITNELNNVQVEEQIEMLVREKQYLLEKLKSLPGVSSTDSIIETFEIQKESRSLQGDAPQASFETEDRSSIRLDEQQAVIAELQSAIRAEKEKVIEYQNKIEKLEESLKVAEHVKPESVDEGGDSAKAHKLNANVKNKIKKMQQELMESRKTIQQQNEKLEELNGRLDEKEQLIKNYIEKIELFEKDDWGRENDWKASQDEFEHVQELQKKCLSLENGLLELTEDCERLRKENIEVVHLLSEEKVKRKKLMEKYHIEDYSDPTTVDSMSKSLDDWTVSNLEEKIYRLVDSAEVLEEKLRKLEMSQLSGIDQSEIVSNLEEIMRETQDKLEWSNIVLTSKETEIFRLQNLVEDNSKTIEDLQSGLRETSEKLAEKDAKLAEVMGQLEIKEREAQAMLIKFEHLQECMTLENARTSSNENQLKQLLATVQFMEADAAKKESELKEIQGILAEKDLDIHNLRQWLDQANSDLTYSYKEQFENIDKCLRDKEQEYSVLLAERNELEEFKRRLTTVSEDLTNQRMELLSKNEALQKALEAKESIIEELNAKLVASPAESEKSPEIEELKIKVKKLAANLKKKVQNEKDLLQQIKDHEQFLAEREKITQKLQDDLTEVNEKWLTEKSEKDQFKDELSTVLAAKSAAETENADLKERLKSMESEFTSRWQKDEYKFQQMETQLQKMYENSERMRLKQEQDKSVIANLESELQNVSRLYESAVQTSTNADEELRKALAETTGKFEETKFKYEELFMEKCRSDAELNELKVQADRLRMDNSCQHAKIQEQMAVIESLENDLTQTQDHLRISQEKLCFLEERRSSLENKTEEMMKKIEEDSSNVVLIEDLSNQIRCLTESEQNLKSTAKSLESKNKELQQELGEMTAEKAKLEKEMTELKQKVNALHGELERMKELDAEKSAMMEFLTNETEKLKSLNKQRSGDVDKLHKDMQLLEEDLEENVENSKTVERTLTNKIDELLKENAALTEKINALPEQQEEAKPVKRKKSVTFRTDETDYIRELKGKVQEYSEELKKSNEEIERVKMELFRERLKNEVTEVVSEAREKVESLKSTPEKEVKPTGGGEERKFDAASFFGAPEETTFDGLVPVNMEQTSLEHDSLMWDDGWGTDGHLEEQYLSSQSPEKSDTLERELKALQGEKQKLQEELQAIQTKYAKAIKKMKEQKTTCEKLQAEVNRLKSDAEFGGLDAAMMDELKSQIAGFEQRERELVKNLEASKTEKDGLLKVIEVLNAGKEKFQEMKERQDNQMEVWETKNRELQSEITELRKQLEGRDSGSPHIDENDVIRELRNKIEGLEWENCELKESLEEKQEMLDMRKDEPKEKKTEVTDLEEMVANLPTETLQGIIDERRKAEEPMVVAVQAVAAAAAPPQPQPSNTETKIFDYFKAAPANDVFSSVFAQPVYTEPVVEPIVERKVATQVQASNDHLEKELEQLRVENELLQQQLSEAQSIITKIKNERHEMAEKYRAEYESALSFHLEEKNNALQKVYELEQALAIKIEELNNISTRMRDLDQAVTLKTEEFNSVNKGRQELEQAFGMKVAESSNMQMRVNELEQALMIKAETLNTANGRLAELETALAVKNEELNNTVRSLTEVQGLVRVREEELVSKTDEVSKLSEKVKELEDECNRRTAALENVQKTYEEQLRCVQSNVPEIESLVSSLTAEKSAVEELKRVIGEREELIRYQAEEITFVKNRLNEVEGQLKELAEECEKQRSLTEEYCNAKEKLEDLVSNLQTELETANMELSLSRTEMESLRRANEETIAELEGKIETELREADALKEELRTKTEECERRATERESAESEEMERVRKASKAMEQHMEKLKAELKEKENDIFELSQTLDEEQKQLTEVRALLEVKDAEISELKQALTGFQEEITSFRNFEKQVKELRMAQIKQTDSSIPVTAEGNPDFTNWTEHELAELGTRLQSDLDTALYMLHQRDIRCDELTFELMQLLEERDTLQLRLSTAIRINEELRSLASNDKVSYSHDTRQENKDLVDQSNDRQGERAGKVPEEDLQELAQKISELHSVGYMKDKTVQDDSMQRHRDQMTLLGRVSNLVLGRDAAGSPPVNHWIRTGKAAPKVMHI